MKYMYLKNKNKNIKLKKLIKISLIITILSLIIKTVINIEQFYIKYTEEIIKKETANIINDSIDKEVINYLYENEIIKIDKNNKGEIEKVEYNNLLINNYTEKISHKLNKEFKKDKNKNIKIPITALFSNSLLNNISPKINIKTNTLTRISTNVDFKPKEYGINNVIIEIYLTVIAERKVILPIMSKDIIVEVSNPISYIVINGKTPDYYKNDFNTNNGDTSIENKN